MKRKNVIKFIFIPRDAIHCAQHTKKNSVSICSPEIIVVVGVVATRAHLFAVRITFAWPIGACVALRIQI